MRALLTGTLAVALLTAYTLLLFALLAPLILLKLLTRPLPPIAPLDAAVVAIADTWNRLNAAGMQWASGTRWQLSLPEGLSRQAGYLVICNHQSQQSPFRHLLRPKAGGVMSALEVLGDRLDAVLDVTIVYPGQVPRFIDVLCGRVPHVRVHVERLPVPLAADGGPLDTAALQAWLGDRWQAKDARFAQLASGHPLSGGSAAPR